MSTYKNKAIDDLKFIKQVLKTESAGGHDKQKLHARFHYWLNTGYKQALKDIDSIKSYKAYRKVISDYWYGFKDSHMVLRFLKPYKKPNKNIMEMLAKLASCVTSASLSYWIAVNKLSRWVMSR